MSGSSIGSAVAVFSNLRCGAAPTWTPPYIKADGSKVSSRASFTGYKNSKKGKDQATGEKGRKDHYNFTVWGTLADSIARCMTPGKEFSCICEPQQYSIPVMNAQGQQMVGADGKPMTSSKVSFLITGGFMYGEDSTNTILDEIRDGRRPAFYNVLGHEHNATWKAICQARAAKYAWNGQSANYGYAKVTMPREKGVQINMVDHAAEYKNVIQPLAPVAAPVAVQTPQAQVMAAANGPMQNYVHQTAPIVGQAFAPVAPVAPTAPAAAVVSNFPAPSNGRLF